MRNRLSRRRFLAGSAALAAIAPVSAKAQLVAAVGRGFVDVTDFGVVADGGVSDQSDKMREAVNAAAGIGLPLFIPGGTYGMNHVDLPSSITVFGVRGATNIVSLSEAPIFQAFSSDAVTLRDLSFDGRGNAGNIENQGLLVIYRCTDVVLERLTLSKGPFAGISIAASSGLIEDCSIDGFGEGIFAMNNRAMRIAGNRVSNCADAGIKVWASDPNEENASDYDGTIVADNEIRDIRFDGGGNGQNGNGINVFRANGVVVTGNRIKGCAFSAIRLNSSNDTIVNGNTCLDSGEVAIFSEFAFSGSVISNNIVDKAAQGISMTNFDQGGRLATCTGNVVRNITPTSKVNPDTTPVGIFAEADAVIANNVVDSVPGMGIGAGWGPYLRNVAVTGNVVRDAEIGIGISVADGAGKAVVAGNQVSETRRAGIAGMAWTDIASDDLARDAGKFPNVTVGGNSVS